jgi:hypothetical protein
VERLSSTGLGLLGRSFLAVLDLQLLLGAVLLASPEPGPPPWPHALIMLVAIAVAHVLRRRLRSATPEQSRRVLLSLFSLPLLVVALGLLLLR